MSNPNQPGNAAQQASQDSKSPPQAQVPPSILQQAGDAVATAAATAAGAQSRDGRSSLDNDHPIEEVPPPPYSADQYGEIDINEKGMDTGARVQRDGRVEIKISSKNRTLTNLLRHQLDTSQDPPTPEPEIPEGLGYISGLPPPPMNIVIQIVGSRGDVQPFVALGQVLKDKFNHRVRIATHPVFKDFVTENRLEFFSIGGDPAELMAFMVKNPGLMPGIEAIRSGDIGKRRKGIYEMIQGCWRSCIEPGDGTGIAASDDMLEGHSIDSAISMGDPSEKPFVADAIIANPPSFAHLHIAEKLGIPLHLMFTMPWSPTQSFPHPLANIVSSNADPGMTNFLSYILVDLLTWQGVGDVINRFREKTLSLEPLSIIWAPGNLHRLKIPWTYCWSPALIPKPKDWRSTIDISGFYFLNLATNYTPPADLAEFLDAGPPPVYIGFGSIVVDDPNAMTKLIFEAVKKTGQRALVSKGWGGLSGDEMGVPEGVFMLGNCPHDWLFKKVSCVVHHGGAGTTAAGIAAGRPTIIVPFFGDQQFWGQMCHRAGAGPEPIPHKELTADKLAEAINYSLKPDVLDRAKAMCDKIKTEKGSDAGAESFHRHLSLPKMRCSICPGRVAVWQYKKSDIRLSALAATVLANEGHLQFSDLRLYRSHEYIPDTGPPEPITGGAAALIGSIGQVTAGVADYPAEILKSFKKGSNKNRETDHESPGPSTPTSASTSNPTNRTPSQANIVITDSDSGTGPSASQVSIADTDTGKETVTRSPESFSRTTSAANTSIPSASTSSLRPDVDSRHSRASSNSSTKASGSRTPKGHERSPSTGRAQQITVDSVVGSAKATGNIVAAGMKSPLDFTMSLAQGFHNAPKLYGDKTVRPVEKVTGFQSGLKVAGKEFGYGMYDGITGLVTQPLQGAKEEGLAGFGKGLLKAGMGVWLKPGAAIWGLPGYTMKGIYAEIVKNFGKSTANYIIAARTAQGYEEWKESGAGERERIVATWKSEAISNKHKSKQRPQKQQPVHGGADDSRFYGDDGKLLKGFMNTRHLSHDDRKKLDQMRKEARKEEKRKSKEPSKSDKSLVSKRPENMSTSTDAEFEQAIRTAVQQTSQNNPEEDERIERAIRASVREFQRGTNTGPGQGQGQNTDDEDEAYNRAINASIAEYRRPLAHSSSTGQQGDTITTTLETSADDEQFSKALAASLEEARRAHMKHGTSDEETNTEDDEEYAKAIEASKSAHTPSGNLDDDDEEYKRAIEESMRSYRPKVPGSQLKPNPAFLRTSVPPSEPPPSYDTTTSSTVPVVTQSHTSNSPGHDDEEYQKALQASQQDAKQRELDLEKQRTEDEIVMEYVKRQSLAEEEYRRKHQGQQ